METREESGKQISSSSKSFPVRDERQPSLENNISKTTTSTMKSLMKSGSGSNSSIIAKLTGSQSNGNLAGNSNFITDKKVSKETSYGKHTYSLAECQVIMKLVGNILDKNMMAENLIKPWPLTQPSDLFDACRADGWIITILCHHVHGIPIKISQKTIARNPLSCRELLEKALSLLKNSVSGNRHGISTIGVEDVLAGTEHLCLSLFWTILKMFFLSPVTANLAVHGDGKSETLKVTPVNREIHFITWINDLLLNKDNETQELPKMSQSSLLTSPTRPVRNLASDLADGIAYLHLLLKLDLIEPGQFESMTTSHESPEDDNPKIIFENIRNRWQTIQTCLQKIQCDVYVVPEEMAKGNQNLNLILLANLHEYHSSQIENKPWTPLHRRKSSVEDDDDLQVLASQNDLQQDIEDTQLWRRKLCQLLMEFNPMLPQDLKPDSVVPNVTIESPLSTVFQYVEPVYRHVLSFQRERFNAIQIKPGSDDLTLKTIRELEEQLIVSRKLVEDLGRVVVEKDDQIAKLAPLRIENQLLSESFDKQSKDKDSLVGEIATLKSKLADSNGTNAKGHILLMDELQVCKSSLGSLQMDYDKLLHRYNALKVTKIVHVSPSITSKNDEINTSKVSSANESDRIIGTLKGKIALLETELEIGKSALDTTKKAFLRSEQSRIKLENDAKLSWKSLAHYEVQQVAADALRASELKENLKLSQEKVTQLQHNLIALNSKIEKQEIELSLLRTSKALPGFSNQTKDPKQNDHQLISPSLLVEQLALAKEKVVILSKELDDAKLNLDSMVFEKHAISEKLKIMQDEWKSERERNQDLQMKMEQLQKTFEKSTSDAKAELNNVSDLLEKYQTLSNSFESLKKDRDMQAYLYSEFRKKLTQTSRERKEAPLLIEKLSTERDCAKAKVVQLEEQLQSKNDSACQQIKLLESRILEKNKQVPVNRSDSSGEETNKASVISDPWLISLIAGHAKTIAELESTIRVLNIQMKENEITADQNLHKAKYLQEEIDLREEEIAALMLAKSKGGDHSDLQFKVEELTEQLQLIQSAYRSSQSLIMAAAARESDLESKIISQEAEISFTRDQLRVEAQGLDKIKREMEEEQKKRLQIERELADLRFKYEISQNSINLMNGQISRNISEVKTLRDLSEGLITKNQELSTKTQEMRDYIARLKNGLAAEKASSSSLSSSLKDEKTATKDLVAIKTAFQTRLHERLKRTTSYDAGKVISDSDDALNVKDGNSIPIEVLEWLKFLDQKCSDLELEAAQDRITLETTKLDLESSKVEGGILKSKIVSNEAKIASLLTTLDRKSQSLLSAKIEIATLSRIIQTNSAQLKDSRAECERLSNQVALKTGTSQLEKPQTSLSQDSQPSSMGNTSMAVPLPKPLFRMVSSERVYNRQKAAEVEVLRFKVQQLEKELEEAFNKTLDSGSLGNKFESKLNEFTKSNNTEVSYAYHESLIEKEQESRRNAEKMSLTLEAKVLDLQKRETQNQTKISSLESAISKLTDENKLLGDTIQEIMTNAKKVSDMAIDERVILKPEIESMRKYLEKERLHSQILAAERDKLLQQVAEKHDLSNEIQNLQSQIKDYISKLAQMSHSLERVENEKATIQKEIKDMKNLLEDSEIESGSLKRQVKQSTKALTDVRKDRDDIENSLNDLRSKYYQAQEQLEQISLDGEALLRDSLVKEAELQSLTKNLEKSKELEKSVSMQLSESKLEIQRLTKELESEKAGHILDVEASNVQLEALKKSKRSLEKRLEKAIIQSTQQQQHLQYMEKSLLAYKTLSRSNLLRGSSHNLLRSSEALVSTSSIPQISEEAGTNHDLEIQKSPQSKLMTPDIEKSLAVIKESFEEEAAAISIQSQMYSQSLRESNTREKNLQNTLEEKYRELAVLSSKVVDLEENLQKTKITSEISENSLKLEISTLKAELETRSTIKQHIEDNISDDDKIDLQQVEPEPDIEVVPETDNIKLMELVDILQDELDRLRARRAIDRQVHSRQLDQYEEQLELSAKKLADTQVQTSLKEAQILENIAKIDLLSQTLSKTQNELSDAKIQINHLQQVTSSSQSQALQAKIDTARQENNSHMFELLQTQIDSLQKENSFLRARADGLDKALIDRDRAQSEYIKSKSLLNQNIEALTKEMTAIKELETSYLARISELESELLNRQELMVSNARQRQEDEVAKNTLQHQLQQLQKINSTLETQVKTLEDSLAKIKDMALKDEVDSKDDDANTGSLSNSKVVTASMVQLERTKITGEFQDRLQTRLLELRKAQAERDNYAESNERLKRSLAETQLKCSQTENINSKLQEQLDILRSEIETRTSHYESTIQRISKELDDCLQRYDRLLTQNGLLNQSITKLSAEQQTLEQQVKDLQLKLNQAEATKSSISKEKDMLLSSGEEQLNALTSKLDQSQILLHKLGRNIEELEGEKQRLSSQLESQKSLNESYAKALEGNRSTANSQIQALEETIKDLKMTQQVGISQRDSLTISMEDSKREIKRLQDLKAILESRLKIATDESSTLHEQYQNLQKSVDANLAQREMRERDLLDELNGKEEILVQTREDLSRTSENLQSIKEKYTSLLNQTVKLEKELHNRNEEFYTATQLIGRIEEEASNWQYRMENQNQILNSLAKEKIDLLESLSKSQSHVLSLTTQLENINAANQEKWRLKALEQALNLNRIIQLETQVSDSLKNETRSSQERVLLLKQLADAENKLKQTKADLEDESIRFQDYRKSVEEKRDKQDKDHLEVHIIEVAQREKRLVELESKVASLEIEKLSWENEQIGMKTLIAKANELQMHFDRREKELINSLTETQQSQLKIEDELQHSLLQLKMLESQNDANRATEDELRQKIKELEQSVWQNQADAQQAKELAKDQLNRIAYLENNDRNWQQVFQDKVNELKSLNNNILELKDKNKVLQTRLSFQEKDSSELRQKIANFGPLEATLQSQTLLLAKLQQDNSIAESKRISLEIALDESNKKLRLTMDDLENLEKRYAEQSLSLQTQLNAYRSRALDLESRLGECNQRLEVAQGSWDRAKASLDAVERELASSKARNATLQEQFSLTTETLKSFQGKEKTIQGRIEQLDRLLSESRAQNNELLQITSKLQKDIQNRDSEISQLRLNELLVQAKLNQLESKTRIEQDVSSKVENEPDSASNYLSQPSKEDSLKNEIKDLHMKLDIAIGNLSILEKEKERLEKANLEHLKSIKELQLVPDAFIEENKNLQKSIQMFRERKIELEHELRTTKTQRDELESRLKSNELDLSRISMLSEKLALKEQELEASKRENVGLESKIESITNFCRLAESKQSHSQTLAEEIQQSLSISQKALLKCEGEKQELEKTLENVRKQFENEKLRFKESLTAVESNAHAIKAEKDILSLKLADMNRQLSQAQDQIFRSNLLETSTTLLLNQQTSEFEKLQNKINSSEALISKLQSDLEFASKERSEYQIMALKLASFEKMAEELNDQISVLKEEKVTLESKCSLNQRASLDLSSQIREMRLAHTKVMSELELIKSERDLLDSKLQNLNDTSLEQQEAIKIKIQECETLKETNRKLTLDLNQYQAVDSPRLLGRIEVLESDIVRLKEALELRMNQIKSLQSNEARLFSELQEKEKILKEQTVISLGNTILGTQQKDEEFVRDLDYEIKVETLQKELNKTKAELTNEKVENENLKKEKERMDLTLVEDKAKESSQITELNSHIIDLKFSLNKSQQAVASLQERFDDQAKLLAYFQQSQETTNNSTSAKALSNLEVDTTWQKLLSERLETSQKKITDLQNSMFSLKSEFDQIKIERDKLLIEANRLKSELKTKIEEGSQATQRATTLTRDNKTVISQLYQLQENLSKEQELRIKLQNELSNSNSEKRHLIIEKEKAIYESSKVVERIEMERTKLQEIINYLEPLMPQQQEEISKLKGELRESRQKCVVQETNLTALLEAMAKTNDSLNQQLEEYGKLKIDSTKKSEIISDLERKVSVNEAQLALINQEKASNLEEINSLKDHIKKLEFMVQEENESFNKSRSASQKVLLERNQAIQNLENQLKQNIILNKENERRLRNEIDVLVAKIRSQEQNLIQVNATSSDLEYKLLQTNNSLEQELKMNIELSSRIQELETLLKNALQANPTNGNNVIATSSTDDLLTTEGNSSIYALIEDSARVTNLRALTMAQEELRKALETIDDLQGQALQNGDALMNLQEKLTDSMDRENALRLQIVDYERDDNDKTRALTEATNKLAELEEKMLATNKNLDDLKSENSRLSNTLQEISPDFERYKVRVLSLEKELDEKLLIIENTLQSKTEIEVQLMSEKSQNSALLSKMEEKSAKIVDQAILEKESYYEREISQLKDTIKMQNNNMEIKRQALEKLEQELTLERETLKSFESKQIQDLLVRDSQIQMYRDLSLQAEAQSLKLKERLEEFQRTDSNHRNTVSFQKEQIARLQILLDQEKRQTDTFHDSQAVIDKQAKTIESISLENGKMQVKLQELESSISQIQGKLNISSAQKLELESERDDLRSMVSRMQARAQKAEARFEDIREKFDERLEAQKIAERDFQDAQLQTVRQLDESKAFLAKSQEASNILKKERDEFKADVLKWKTETERIAAIVEPLQIELKEQSIQYDKLKKDFDVTVPDLKSSIKKLMTELEREKEQVNMKSRENTEIRNLLLDSKSELQKESTEKGAALIAIEELKREIIGLEMDNKELTNSKTCYEQKLQELELTLAQKNEEWTDLEARHEALSSKNKENLEQTMHAESSLSKALSNLKDVTIQRDELQAKSLKLSEDLNLRIEMMDQMSKDLQIAVSHETVLQNDLEKSRKALETLTGNLEALVVDKSQLHESLDRAYIRSQELQEERLIIQSKLNSANIEIAALKEDLEIAQRTVTEFEERLESKEDRLNELGNVADTARNNLDRIQSENQSNIAELEILQNRENEMKEKILIIENERDNLKTQLELSILETQKQAENLKSLVESIGALQSLKDEIQSQLIDAELKTQTQAKQLLEQDSDLQAEKENLLLAQNELTQYKEIVIKYQETIDNLLKEQDSQKSVISKLREEKDLLQKEKRELEISNTKITSKLESSERQLIDKTNDNQSKIDNIISQMQKEHAEAVSEVQRQSNLQQAQLQAQIEVRIDELKRIKEMNEKLRNQVDHIHDLEAIIRRHNEDEAIFVKRLAESESRVTDLNAKIKEKAQELQEKINELTQSSLLVGSLRIDVEIANKKLSQRHSEIGELRERLKGERETIKRLEADCESAREQIAAHSSQKQSLEVKIDSLYHDQESLKRKVKEYEIALQSNQDGSKLPELLKQDNRQLLAEREELSGKLSSTEALVGRLKDQIKVLEAGISESVRNASQITEITEQLNRVSAMLNQTRLEKESLQKDMNDLEKSRETSNNEYLITKANYEEEIGSLKIMALESENACRNATENLHQSQQQNFTLQKKISELEALIQEGLDREKKNQSLDKTEESLKMQVQLLQEANEALQADLEVTKITLNKAMTERSIMEMEATRLRQNADVTEKSLQDNLLAMKKLSDARNEDLEAIQKLVEKLGNREKDLSLASSKISQLGQEIMTLLEENDRLKKDANGLAEESFNVSEEKSNLLNKLKTLERELASQQEKVASLQEQVNLLRQSNKDLDMQLHIKLEEYSQLKTENVKIAGDLSEATNNVVSFSNRVRVLEAERDSLQAQLTEITKIEGSWKILQVEHENLKTDSKRTINNLRQDLQKANIEKCSVDKEVSKIREQLLETDEKFRSTQTILEQIKGQAKLSLHRMQALEQRNSLLESQVKDSEAKIVKGLKDSEDMIKLLKEKIKSLDMDNQELSIKFRQSLSDNRSLENNNAALRNDNRQLTESLELWTTSLARLQASASQETERTDKTAKAYHQQISALLQRETTRLERIRSLQEQLTSETTTHAQESFQTNESLASMERELTAKISHLERELTKAKAKVDSARQNVSKVHIEYQEKEEAWARKIRSLMSRESELTSKLEKAEMQSEEFSKLNENQLRIILGMKQMPQALQEEAIKVTAEANEALHKAKAKESQVKSLEVRLAAREDTIVALEKTIVELTLKLGRASEEKKGSTTISSTSASSFSVRKRTSKHKKDSETEDPESEIDHLLLRCSALEEELSHERSVSASLKRMLDHNEASNKNIHHDQSTTAEKDTRQDPGLIVPYKKLVQELIDYMSQYGISVPSNLSNFDSNLPKKIVTPEMELIKEANESLKMWLKKRGLEEEMPCLNYDTMGNGLKIEDLIEELLLLLKFVYDRVGLVKVSAPTSGSGLDSVRLKQAELLNINYQSEIKQLKSTMRRLQESLLSLNEKNRILSLHEPEWSLERRQMITKIEDLEFAIKQMGRKTDINGENESVDTVLRKAFSDMIDKEYSHEKIPTSTGISSLSFISILRRFMEDKLDRLAVLEREKTRFERQSRDLHLKLQEKEKALMILEEKQSLLETEQKQKDLLAYHHQNLPQKLPDDQIEIPVIPSSAISPSLHMGQRNQLLTQQNQTLAWELGLLQQKHKQNLRKNQEAMWKLYECNRRIENYEKELNGPVKTLQSRCDTLEAEMAAIKSSQMLVSSRCQTLLTWMTKEQERIKQLTLPSIEIVIEEEDPQLEPKTKSDDMSFYLESYEKILSNLFNRITVTMMAFDRLSAEKKMWSEFYKKLRQDHLSMFHELSTIKTAKTNSDSKTNYKIVSTSVKLLPRSAIDVESKLQTNDDDLESMKHNHTLKGVTFNDTTQE